MLALRRLTARAGQRALVLGGMIVSAILFGPIGSGTSPQAVPVYETDHHAVDVIWLSDTDTGASEERTILSQPIVGPFAFSAIGVLWQGALPEGASVALEVRVMRGDDWTSWYRLVNGTEGPLLDNEWHASSLLHVAPAEAAQLRFTLSEYAGRLSEVQRVEAHLLHSRPAGQRLVVRRLTSVLAAERVSKPPVVTRALWGADEKLRFEPDTSGRLVEVWEREYQPVSHVVLHHTAGPNLCALDDLVCQRQSVEAMNLIYYYHAKVLGWGDIGYNAIIGYDGRIYAGRHGSDRSVSDPLGDPVVAGHVRGYNYGTYGIAIMGDFSEVPLPINQYRALVDLLGWVLTAPSLAPSPLDPTEVATLARLDGSGPQQVPRLLTHGDLDATEEPGPYFFAILSELRRDVLARTLWPPVHLEVEARPSPDGGTFLATVHNHASDQVGNFRIRVAVPDGARLVDSWAGVRGSHRGVFDGREVAWADPDTVLTPYRRQGPFAVELSWPPGTAREDMTVHFWMSFHDPLFGTATSRSFAALFPTELIVDSHKDPGAVEVVGNWPTSTNVYGYYYSGYRLNASGEGSERFTWRVDIPVPGRYEVFAWWTAAADRATNAPYTIAHAQGATRVRVDQTRGGSRWQTLGTYTFNHEPAVVDLTDEANGFVIADAIRLVRVR